MSQKQHSSIGRKGLDSSFEAEETKKSKLLLQAQLLREQNQGHLPTAKAVGLFV